MKIFFSIFFIPATYNVFTVVLECDIERMLGPGNGRCHSDVSITYFLEFRPALFHSLQHLVRQDQSFTEPTNLRSPDKPDKYSQKQLDIPWIRDHLPKVAIRRMGGNSSTMRTAALIFRFLIYQRNVNLKI